MKPRIPTVIELLEEAATVYHSQGMQSERFFREAASRIRNEMRDRENRLDASVKAGHLTKSHGEGEAQYREIRVIELINGGRQ